MYIKKIIKKLLTADRRKRIIDYNFETILNNIIHDKTQSTIDLVISGSDLTRYESIIKTKKEFQDFTNQISISLFRDNVIDALVKSGLNNNYSYSGFCSVCKKDTEFDISLPWTTFTEGVATSRCCLLSSRMRFVYDVVLKHYKPGMTVYASEQITSFYKKLKNIIPDLIGSEFLPPEQRNGKIHFEDATKLSFDNESIDLYISNDVLEHVSDYKLAFSEAYRVLKHGGKFIFHIPFYFLDKTEIRAELTRNGKINFIKNPIYHGDPLSKNGALVFTDFGWDLFDLVRSYNVSDFYMYMVNDIRSGYLHSNSFCFIMEK